MNVLWIAPNLNHYKSRFLNRLASDGLGLTVLAGRELKEVGHACDAQEAVFQLVSVNVEKSYFQYRPVVYRRLTSLIKETRPHSVLMPIEKKYSILILYLSILRLFMNVRLVSYNHERLKSKASRYKFMNRILTRTFYKIYDRVIFYTEDAMDSAVEDGLVNRKKAHFANNTLDTKSIWEICEFKINTKKPNRFLFIGRLVPSKRLNVLFDYFSRIGDQLSECELKIIGDGPERNLVVKAAAGDSRIEWLGAIVDEKEISRHMSDAKVVFVAGHTGLSIVHAFCYGKPYLALREYDNHPPEISYLKNGENGLLLDGNMLENVTEIVDFLTDNDRYSRMCQKAFETAQSLSIEKWCEQMKHSLDSPYE